MASHVCAHLGGEHSCHGRQEGAPALWGLHGGRLRVPGVGWIQAMVPLEALQAYGVSVDATYPDQKAGGACRTAVHQPTGHQVCDGYCYCWCCWWWWCSWLLLLLQVLWTRSSRSLEPGSDEQGPWGRGQEHHRRQG